MWQFVSILHILKITYCNFFKYALGIPLANELDNLCGYHKGIIIIENSNGMAYSAATPGKPVGPENLNGCTGYTIQTGRMLHSTTGSLLHSRGGGGIPLCNLYLVCAVQAPVSVRLSVAAYKNHSRKRPAAGFPLTGDSTVYQSAGAFLRDICVNLHSLICFDVRGMCGPRHLRPPYFIPKIFYTPRPLRPYPISFQKYSIHISNLCQKSIPYFRPKRLNSNTIPYEAAYTQYQCQIKYYGTE